VVFVLRADIRLSTNSVVTTTELGTGLSGDRIPVGGQYFSHPSRPAVEAHPASYTMGTGFLLGEKAARAWR
jgi:hypothetical protein